MRFALLTSREHDPLIDSIADPVLVLDRDCAIIDINLAALRLAGSPPQWHGRPADTLLPFLDGASIVGTNATQEFTIEADGTTYEVRVSRLRARRAAWLVLLRDITARLRRAAEREEFVRRNNELIAAISQELRTPVGVIQGALQLVLGSSRSALMPEDRRLLEGALRGCDRLARIVHEILDISTIEAARPSGPQPFGVERLVIDALFDVADRAEQKSIRISSTVPPDLPLVLGVYDRLVTALASVLSNAVEETAVGSTVAIEGTREDGSVVLTVRGDGQAVAPDPVSEALVAQHGGSITLSGAAVLVRLPVAESTVARDAPAASRAARILIADDDPDLRDVVTEALEANGFSVVAAEDGRQAIEILAHDRIDLAVLDLNMPNGTGDEVVSHVRSGTQQPSLPVVMLTGSLDERQAMSHPGPDVVLTKPADLRRLIAEIRSLLGNPAKTA